MARFLHDCNRPIGKLPDRLRHRTARRFPKNHVRRFFRRTFRFFSSVTSAANDSQSERVSPLFLDPEPPTLDQPPAHQDRALALRCPNKHWHRTDCLCSPQNREQYRKRRQQRAKFRRRIAQFLPRKKSRTRARIRNLLSRIGPAPNPDFCFPLYHHVIAEKMG